MIEADWKKPSPVVQGWGAVHRRSDSNCHWIKVGGNVIGKGAPRGLLGNAQTTGAALWSEHSRDPSLGQLNGNILRRARINVEGAQVQARQILPVRILRPVPHCAHLTSIIDRIFQRRGDARIDLRMHNARFLHSTMPPWWPIGFEGSWITDRIAIRRRKRGRHTLGHARDSVCCAYYRHARREPKR